MDQAQHVKVTPPYLARADQTAEISLVDLALVVWRHRRPAFFTVLTFAALGIAAALVLPKKYAYTTTIEIGSRVEDGKVMPIEAPDTALAKLKEGYIPQARRHYLEAHPEVDKQFVVEARVPKGSGLVVLESTAPEQDGAAYQYIQGQAVQTLVADHGRVFENQRTDIALAKQRAEGQLRALVDQEALLKTRIERLKSRAQLLEQQIADTRQLIEGATANRSRAVAEARDEARAMTLLMLDSEVRANRARLAELQQQLQIDLATERDTLQAELQENQRSQARQQAEVQHFDQQLKNLQETRAMVLGMQSLKPVGTSRSLIVLLSILLGGLLALLVPLVLEFAGWVRASVAAQSPDRATGESA